MGSDGFEMLSGLSRLSEVSGMKQVKPLSYALFPGYHCPLMGAMLTMKETENAVMVVIGPDECAYYIQMATSGGSMKAHGCKIVSVVLDQHDVTFGCQEKMDEAFSELMEEYCPEAVYLVTTCVVEVTGDDIEAMAVGYSEKYKLPVMVVHAENFKTDDHLPGIANTLDASLAIMEQQEISECVNVLGMRLGDFTKTELYRVLHAQGIEPHLMLPGKTSVEKIRRAPCAKCNIVVHPVGLPLAVKMQEKFGTPYVIFERYSDPDRIFSAYERLFKVLKKELPTPIYDNKNALKRKIPEIRKLAEGKTYISGNTALAGYELHAFLAGALGMRPLLLQISDLDPEGESFREELLQHADPYVTRSANIGAMRSIYPALKPDFNIGAGDTRELMAQKIATLRFVNAYNTLGFEVADMVLNAVLQAEAERKMMKEVR